MSRFHIFILAFTVLAFGSSGCSHTAQVTGTVKFKDGTPVEGAEVQLFDSHAALFVMREINKGSSITDKDGRFRFDRVRYSHTLDVRVRGQDCRWWGNGWAILERDPSPPEEYDVQISLLRKECNP